MHDKSSRLPAGEVTSKRRTYVMKGRDSYLSHTRSGTFVFGCTYTHKGTHRTPCYPQGHTGGRGCAQSGWVLTVSESESTLKMSNGNKQRQGGREAIGRSTYDACLI
jgi:hypothetical protein